MTLVLVALAGVLVVEGLVLALAPSRLEDLLRALCTIPKDMRRILGLAALACGVILLWVARGLM
ncbi:DUF2065 domain-containing protein [Meridianimarinicoccus aquatilis]|uniref:DUF2065 domain-containing protein n=1 Tax=Meridianimarinicoccus aquatilis TaxID=2552766 RepID=A0A4R6ACK4_9RHOB|nr:DUF2065 domain-containing protein [Fluviibacterium aquatile]QIE42436.1 DUF2065 domain-containing protein [Rhodobacteraceae bacterium SC52]TDL81731.1 DUF2065 domain-containing protein [Fluviibacterium aquatile]